MTPRTQQWLVLAVVLMGTFMAILDVAIVNVAIPSIRGDLHASFGEVELVISAYTLTYACLLVTGGRLGDLYGRKRLFILGLLVFGAASALCGLAPTAGVLIGARAIQGVGGALMYPQVLAIIQVTFAGEERGKALGIFGSVIGLAAIAGQILGGLLLAADLWGLTWRPIFLVNVPLALGTMIAAAFVLGKDQRLDHVGLDWGGVGLITPALCLLVIPLLEGRELGWPVWLVGCLIAAVPIFGLFVWYERRLGWQGGTPLVPVDLFANRSFAFGIPIAGLFTASYAGFLLILAVYLQVGLNFSPLHSGLTYTPSAVGFLITSLAAPRLVPLLGRHVLSVGYVTAAFGLLGTATTAYAAGARLQGFELAPFLFVTGLGQGLGMSPLVGTVIAGLRAQEAGAGAGVVTTTLQIGNALGIAVISLLFFSLLGQAAPGAAYADAFAKALPASAALLLVAAWLVRKLPVTPFEASNALLERLPGWSGLAYSMFLMTGGRVGGSLFEDVLSHIAARRTLRTREAPAAPGEFLVYHFRTGEADAAWLHYLMREALTYGNRTVPHEAERLPVIKAQVEEIRRRQAEGLLPKDIDPAMLRLFGFALVSYPRLLSQVTRMTTTMSPDDPKFAAAWENLLRRIGNLLEDTARRESDRGP
jgi:EmrB/QacA subfamily drug resistance transporter